jgi:stress response protein YsnF
LPASENLKEVGDESFTESEDTPEVVEEQIVRLLEERLIVNRSKRKVGEIVVRKKIETRFVEVPVQREKLIIEQVGSESKQPVETERLSLEEFSGHSPTPLVTPPQDKNQSPKAPFFTTEDLQEVDEQSFTESDVSSEVAEEEIVRLLEERLVVNRSKWKVGEIVVRKEVETTTIQVPIQREKLIIEQVGSETKQLAEIDLAQGEVAGIELTEVPSSDTVERSVPSSDNLILLLANLSLLKPSVIF